MFIKEGLGMFKKSLAIILSTVLCFSVSGCNFSSTKVDDMLNAPKPSGDLYNIQTALEKYVGGSVDLRYPRSGEYRSAFVLQDIDNDGIDEAFAFYGTKNDDNTTLMHINMINCIEDKWVSASDIQMQSSGVDCIKFCDLDGDGIMEVVVGWNKYSVLGRELTVFSINSGKLVQRMQVNYSVFSLCDINSDGVTEIVTVYLNSVEKSSIAKAFVIDKSGVLDRGSCMLDGTVLSYDEPTISKLKTGQIAIYIDATKGAAGMITELIYWKNDGITNPFYDTTTYQNITTLRSSTTRCTDFNGDGILNIPFMEALPSVASTSDSEKAYMTYWEECDGTDFSKIAVTVMNYVDGYYFEIPSDWVHNFTIVRKLDSKQRIFYHWNQKTLSTCEELLRIQVFSIIEWENSKSNYDNYFEVARDETNVYVMKLGDSSVLTLDQQTIVNGFHILNTSKGETIN